MFSLLTLVAFGIIGTLLVGIQYYAMHTQSWGLSKLWTKSWMVFFLIMTVRGQPDDCTSTLCASSSLIYLLFSRLFPADNCLLCQCVHASQVAIDALVSVRSEA